MRSASWQIRIVVHLLILMETAFQVREINALNRGITPNTSLDLVLHCTRSNSVNFIQIWLNLGDAGYILARSYDLPPGSGPISFADTSESKSSKVCETNTSSLGRS